MGHHRVTEGYCSLFQWVMGHKSLSLPWYWYVAFGVDYVMMCNDLLCT